jgi:hypothetical protein
MALNEFPTADARRQAAVELVTLAEHLATPRRSFAQALDVARSARPDLAATVDAGFAAPAPSTGRPSSGPRSAVAPSAHQQLLALAETARAGDPALTSEAAYSAALIANPELYNNYIGERADGQQVLPFGEHLGDVLGGGRMPIPRDREYDSRPALWAARGRQLHADGVTASDKQGYALAMAETPGTDSSVRRTASPAPTIDTGDGANHARWSARASELYRSGRAKTWQQGYSDAMGETAATDDQ